MNQYIKQTSDFTLYKLMKIILRLMNYFHLYYFLHICQTYNIAKESLNRQNVTAMHQTSVEGVDDMANLGDLHDAAILHNLHLRFTSDKIYVSFKSLLQKLL